jgi:hypothetical protein
LITPIRCRQPELSFASCHYFELIRHAFMISHGLLFSFDISTLPLYFHYFHFQLIAIIRHDAFSFTPDISLIFADIFD